MSKISSRAAKELKSAIIGTAPKTRTATVATATVVGAGSEVWVQLEGADTPTPVSSTLANVNVGDTVSVRIENGSATVLGNATAPATSAAYVQQTLQPVAVAADTAQSTAETAQSAAEGAAKKADKAQETAEAVEEAVETAEADAAAAKEAADAAATKANTLATELDATNQKVEQTASDLEGVKTTAANAATKADESYSAATTATQTATAAQTKAESAYENASEAITQAATATQTANSVKTELETNYVDKATASSYATKADLTATSESITASVSKTYSTKAETQKVSDAASAAQSTADSANTAAKNAQTTANTANSTANAAQTAAATAQDTADSANTAAKNAQTTANTAKANAATAQDTADKVAQDLATNYTTSADLKIKTDAIESSVSAVTETANATASSVSRLEQTASDLTASVKQNAEGVGDLESLVRVSGTGVEVARKVDGEYTSSRTVIDDDGMEVQSSDGKTVFAKYGKDGTTLYSNKKKAASFTSSGAQIGNTWETYSAFDANGFAITDNSSSNEGLHGYENASVRVADKDIADGLLESGLFFANEDGYTQIGAGTGAAEVWQAVYVNLTEGNTTTKTKAYAIKIDDSVAPLLEKAGLVFWAGQAGAKDSSGNVTYKDSWDNTVCFQSLGDAIEPAPTGKSLFAVFPVTTLSYLFPRVLMDDAYIVGGYAYLWHLSPTITANTVLDWDDQTAKMPLLLDWKVRQSTLTADYANVRRDIAVSGSASVGGAATVEGDLVVGPSTATGNVSIKNGAGAEIINANQGGNFSFGYGNYAAGTGQANYYGNELCLRDKSGKFVTAAYATSAAQTIPAGSYKGYSISVTIPSGYIAVGFYGVTTNHTNLCTINNFFINKRTETATVSVSVRNFSSSSMSTTVTVGLWCIRVSS